MVCSLSDLLLQNEDRSTDKQLGTLRSRFLNFAQASREQVELLSNSCDIASFGLNNKDVVDESYRKAGKLDAAFFSSKLYAEDSGLLQIVRDGLLEGEQAKVPIRAEPYKLNVYGLCTNFPLQPSIH